MAEKFSSRKTIFDHPLLQSSNGVPLMTSVKIWESSHASPNKRSFLGSEASNNRPRTINKNGNMQRSSISERNKRPTSSTSMNISIGMTHAKAFSKKSDRGDWVAGRIQTDKRGAGALLWLTTEVICVIDWDRL
jgi:hypothetical protein